MNDGFKYLIYIKNNELDRDFCNHCIEKFLVDDNIIDGQVGRSRVDKTVKTSRDLGISEFEHWEEEDNIFKENLSKNVQEYIDTKDNVYKLSWYLEQSHDTGYQIQQTEPGGFYIWHDDSRCETKRFLTFIWYLNDIKVDGYTEFIDGTRIQPEAGKIVLFPSTWTYVHRGYPPKEETKYICTGWLSTDIGD